MTVTIILWLPGVKPPVYKLYMLPDATAAVSNHHCIDAPTMFG